MDTTESTVTELTAGGGVTITRTASVFDPAELNQIAELIDSRRGGVLSSGMEYPGRYTRWHLAYVNPPVEIVCRGRTVTARALNERGQVLLPVIRAAMLRAGTERPEAASKDAARPEAASKDAARPEAASAAHPNGADNSKKRAAHGAVTVYVPEGEAAFTEEERSRQPTVFSVLREITAAFACADPHLGLYGAFGYDLAFQFEPVRTAIDRSDDQRDLVLHLPDQIWVVDLRRDEAVRYSYEFTVDTGQAANPAGPAATHGLPRETAATPALVPAAGELPPQPATGRYAAVVAAGQGAVRAG